MTENTVGKWEISYRKRSIAIWTMVALVCVLLLPLTYAISRDTYYWLGTEDALGENLTALFYAVAGILLILNSIREVREGRKATAQILPVLLGLFFIWVGGEEISWGQRILGFGTPEKLAAENYQGEFNLHNLEIFGADSILLDQHRVLNLFVFLNGVLFPVLYLSWKRFRGFLNVINFPIIPLACAGFFLFGMVFEQVMNRSVAHWAHAEIKELVFAIGFLLFGLSVWWRKNRLT